MPDHSPHHEVDCKRLDITVLLVDDDTTTLSLNAGFLRSWQYKVATARSGHEALKTLKEFKGFFDLVITDLNMRGMNGSELQKRVRREFHLPVIIMSGDRRKSVTSRSLEPGAAYCLPKPVRREDWKDVWQYVVAGRREKMRVQNERIVSVSEEEAEEGDSSPKKQRKKYCKRKRSQVIENEELIYCGQKRSKIFWTTNLHNRFLLALNHIGMDKAVPTKILEIMNVPSLTRENVASHLQKYRMFLKRIAEKGFLEGLSERALRSRFAMGLPTYLIRDLQRRVSRLHLHENYHQITQNPPTARLPLANQTRLLQPYNHGTDSPYRNFQQAHYHDRSPIEYGGRFMTSANGLMSNYSSLERRNFNYSPTNYDNNNNHGMIVPYGGHGLQRSPWTYNNHHGTQLNNNNNYSHGLMVPYGSSGLQRRPSNYNNHRGTQLNNNASLAVGALNLVQNVGYPSSGNNNNIFGFLSNENASNNVVVPVSASVVNVCVEANRANLPAGFPSLPQKSVDGIRNNDVTSVNQREAGQMDDLNELFLMINDLVLPDDETAESPRAGTRSGPDILSSFNVEDCLDLFLGDGDHVNAQTSERSIKIVLPNKCSPCTNENPNLDLRNDATTNLEPLDMFMADQANSSAGNLTPQEQDWNMDLLETLLDAADHSHKE